MVSIILQDISNWLIGVGRAKGLCVVVKVSQGGNNRYMGENFDFE